jgi:putative PIN family toxin of toxin-antitoxin system
MLKFVLDTNVLVSALISTGGNPALLLDKAGESYTLYISKDILTEFEAVISRDKFDFTDEDIYTIIEAVISFSEVVSPGVP